jgi:uncharacterized coiled-coil DUF342 family protein
LRISGNRLGIMVQPSKLLKGRNEWREKAIRRADELREQRKVSKRHRETIAELKLKIEDLKQELKEVGAKKKSTRNQR